MAKLGHLTDPQAKEALLKFRSQLAWVLTLPVCVLLGAATFSAALYAVLNIFHMPA